MTSCLGNNKAKILFLLNQLIREPFIPDSYKNTINISTLIVWLFNQKIVTRLFIILLMLDVFRLYLLVQTLLRSAVL